MKTKSQILTVLAEHVTKAQQEYDAMASLVEGLPDIEYEYVHGKSCASYADLLVCLTAKDLEAARLFTLVFPPVPLMQAKDTFTSFLPRDADPKNAGRNPECREIAPVIFRCDNVTQPEIVAVWWCDRAGKRIAVTVRVGQPYDLTRWTGQKRMREGSIYWTDETFSYRFANALHVKWGRGSSEYHPSYTLYFDPCSTMEQCFALGDYRSIN